VDTQEVLQLPGLREVEQLQHIDKALVWVVCRCVQLSYLNLRLLFIYEICKEK